jgi:hypothetical protein
MTPRKTHLNGLRDDSQQRTSALAALVLHGDGSGRSQPCVLLRPWARDEEGPILEPLASIAIPAV